ncbi:MAG TPA: ATP-binding protein, partial [Candidatus Angelobacter sp.]|nr:ATP-binding protein [Candidatus Angelobacter sp.]
MITANATTSWAETNQAHLVAEFARLKIQLGLQSSDVPASAVQLFPVEMETPELAPAIVRLVELFGLSPFERDLLLLCAGVEMDSELAARCAEGQ